MSSNKVYVNRYLNMRRIKCVGFDMDHTLVKYKTRSFEQLTHDTIIDYLVKKLFYPEEVLGFKMDFQRAIRGLVIDPIRGNLLKLSRHGAIAISYHGTRRMHPDEHSSIYSGSYIDLKDSMYLTVDTAFSLAFTSIYARLVEFKDAHSKSAMPTYKEIADDVNQALELAHRSGVLKDKVALDLDRYVTAEPSVAEGLERLKRSGKKIFLLTNSHYAYTRTLLDHTLNPYLKEHKDWQELFEYVITDAVKPRFFYDELPFLRIDPKSGHLSSQVHKLSPGIYYGGCATAFTKELKLLPNDILYVGDHIYGDVVRLKKECAWRTALVVEELEDEILKLAQSAPIRRAIHDLTQQKLQCEHNLSQLESLASTEPTNPELLGAELKKHQLLDTAITEKSDALHACFNPYWGELMKAQYEDSYLAYQVERYACIYMSEIKHFLQLSPHKSYYARARLLAHEQEEHFGA